VNRFREEKGQSSLHEGAWTAQQLRTIKEEKWSRKQNLFFHVFSETFQWGEGWNLLPANLSWRVLFMKLLVQEIKLPGTC